MYVLGICVSTFRYMKKINYLSSMLNFFMHFLADEYYGMSPLLKQKRNIYLLGYWEFNLEISTD